MNEIVGFLKKYQMIFFFVTIFSGGGFFFYLNFVENFGYFRVIIISGLIMAIALGVLTTIRILIYFLLKISGQSSVEETEEEGGLSLTPGRIGFFVFLLRYFSIQIIAFCYVLAFLSLGSFLVNK